MQRYVFGVAVAATVGCTQAATAQPLLELLCPGQGGPVADISKLRYAALAGVPIEALDANGDDNITSDEVFAALTQSDFCSVENGRREACSDDAKIALLKAHNYVDGLWKHHDGADFREKRKPTPDEVAKRPGLADHPWSALLDESKRFVDVRCTASAATEERPIPSDATTVGSPDAPSRKLNLGRFLLGKDVDSLTVQRGAPGSSNRLKKVDQAEIGLLVDNEADTRTVSVSGVAGLKLIDAGAVTLIPFVEYQRAEVRDKKGGTREKSGKLGLGAVATAFLGEDQFDLAPRYAKDIKTDAEVFSARLSWRPGFLYSLPSFRSAYHFACRRAAGGGCVTGSGLAIWTDVQLIGSFGTVLHRADDASLTDGREFLRAGPIASVHVYGLDGIVRDLSFDASYKRLFRLSGDGSGISSFKADINWWVGGSENLSIRYGYERSRDEETLKQTDQWNVGLGVRF